MTHRHEIDYPAGVSEVWFRLEPGAYEKGDVYGEYVKFTGDESVLRPFIESALGEGARTQTPSDYVAWHQGVADHAWWAPLKIENPVFYEDGRRFMTVDTNQWLVYYSYVRSYSDVGGGGSARSE